jgi:hypothetical protein
MALANWLLSKRQQQHTYQSKVFYRKQNFNMCIYISITTNKTEPAQNGRMKGTGEANEHKRKETSERNGKIMNTQWASMKNKINTKRTHKQTQKKKN